MNQLDAETATPETQRLPLSRFEFAVRAVIAGAAFVAVAALAFLLWWGRFVVLMLFAGVVFGVFLHGVSDWISARTKLSYNWSLGIVVALLLVILALTGLLLGAQISEQFSQLANTVPETARKMKFQIQQYEWGERILDQAEDGRNLPGGERMVSQVTGLVGSVLNGITAIVVIAFVGLYGAHEPGLYRAGFLHLVPKPQRPRAGKVLEALNDSLCRWLVARLISMVIIGVLTTLGLWILQVPMALALGVIAFFLEAIPMLGPVLAAIPGILVAWTEGGVHLAGQTLVFYMVLQTIEGYILLPLLQQKTVYLPPLLSIIGIVFFSVIGGVLGAFIAAPLLVVMMILIKMLYVEDALNDHTVESLAESTE